MSSDYSTQLKHFNGTDWDRIFPISLWHNSKSTQGWLLSDRLAGGLNVKNFGAIGDGITDDTSAINNAIAAVPVEGATIFFPPGTYNVSSSINLPVRTIYTPITLMGLGGRDDTVSSGLSGVRINWTGGSSTSVIQISNNLTIQNILFLLGNTSTNVTCLNMNATSAEPVSNCQFLNVFVKGFATGLDMANTWYNTFISCFFSHCTTAINLGDSANSCNFFSCHIARNSIGINTSGSSSQIMFSACSFEVNSNIALNLVSTYYNHSYIDCYFESNNKTAIIKGIGTVIKNAYINHDVPPSTGFCFEIGVQGAPVELDSLRFSDDIPTNQRFTYTGPTTSSTPDIVIGKCYKHDGLAQLLINHPVLYTANLIDVDRSDMVEIESQMLDATNAYLQYLIPPNDLRKVDNLTLVGIYVVVYSTLTNGMTVRFGKSGANYDQYVSQTLAAGTLPGLYSMTMLGNPTLYPDAEDYMFNNTAAGGGLYKMVLLAAG